MNFHDLAVFVAVARQQSLVSAADELHLTPSAVSKALRRLEESFGLALFDRSTRQLVLNPAGTQLVERAHVLLAMAEQMHADLQGASAAVEWRLGGPAILLWREGLRVAQAMDPFPQATLRLEAMFEDEALAALARGELATALVTGAVIEGRGATWSADWRSVELGPVVLHLIAGRDHPLARGGEDAVEVRAAEVLAHPFVCPTRSLFCGEARQSRSDGWRDDVLPRQIRYWTDDLQMLLSLVRSGKALAYLPDDALGEQDMVRLHVTDCPFACEETAWLVWNDRTAPAWLRQLVAHLTERTRQVVGTAGQPQR